MIESCHTCKFWSLTTFTLIGQCRRRAPALTHPQYPETPMQHWCGEYEVIEYRRKEILDQRTETLTSVEVWGERGLINANIQSQSEEVARVESVDRCEEQSESERDCGTPDSTEPELLQATASNSDDRSSGTGVGEAGDPASGRGSLIENKCQDCSKTFMIDFECAVCNDCYSKRQGRKRHYMG